MGSTMMLSLVVLAFLIFMVIVLLYISRAAKEEIEKVKLQMLLRFSVELSEEMYNLDDHDPEERVEKGIKILERVMDDWGIDVDYNEFKMKSKLRKRM